MHDLPNSGAHFGQIQKNPCQAQLIRRYVCTLYRSHDDSDKCILISNQQKAKVSAKMDLYKDKWGNSQYNSLQKCP